MKNFKSIIVFVFLGFASNLYAGAGMTQWAVPTGIEVVTEGIIIYGAFGDKMPCGNDTGVFVNKADTTQYTYVKATALAAYMAKKKMRFYSYVCTRPAGYPVGFNTIYPSRHITIKD